MSKEMLAMLQRSLVFKLPLSPPMSVPEDPCIQTALVTPYIYVPENPRLHTVMVIIYVISGLVAAAILVFLVLFLVQRLACCQGKRDFIDDNVEGSAGDHMLEGAPSGPSVIYKPSANKHPLPSDTNNTPHEAAAFVSPTEAPPEEQKGMLRDSKPPSYDEVLKEDGKL